MKNNLLIDDDFDHLVDLAVALVEAGYQVIPKIDADSAIAVVRGDALVDAGYKPKTLINGGES